MKHRRSWPSACGGRGSLAALLFLGLLLVGVALYADGTGRIYVDVDATSGANDGTSWTDAYTDLQAALAEADAGSGPFEIWVAEGTYKPGATRTATFQLLDGVALYGGFDGTETSRDQRNCVDHETILSGDLNGDDGPDWTDRDDNSNHVVTGTWADATAVLDGFTVRGGNAPYEADNRYGAGMLIWYDGSPTVMHCSFTDNHADHQGGGMYNVGGSPMVVSCTFSGNKSNELGGGMANAGGSATVTDCTFSDNWALGFGGGMSNGPVGSSATVTRCTFFENRALGGGGMYNFVCSPMVTNCTFSGNSAESGGGMYNDNASPTVTHCTFSGNTAPDGSAIYSFADPGGGGAPSLANTIVDGTCYGTPPISNGYNVERRTSCSCLNLTDLQNTDPLLGPLADNGGPTWTHALLAGSPALDAIPPANDYNGAPLTDQRGVARPQPSGGDCDIGAVEMDEPIHANGDVNGDGDVGGDDVAILSEVVLGIRTTLP
jgi:hypothetical protein